MSACACWYLGTGIGYLRGNQNDIYSNPCGVLEGPVHVATFGSGMSEAEIDTILARHDFEHLLGQMIIYAYYNRYNLTFSA